MATAHDIRTDASLATEQCATASQLVRNFGDWQHRAHQRPVYVMNRGTPRLVLTSIELMRRLCAPAAADDDWQAERETLIDALHELVILLDDSLAITATNPAARRYFGLSEAQCRGKQPDQAIAAPLGPFLAEIGRRVLSSGAAERLDIDVDDAGQRALSLSVTPLGSGIAILGEDISAGERRKQAQAAFDALETALASLGSVAQARINARGFLAAPSDSLVRMTGAAPDMLTSVRFAGLFDIASRAPVGQAIEAILSGGTAVQVDAHLNAGGTDPLSVHVALAPYRPDLAVAGVQAILIART